VLDLDQINDTLADLVEIVKQLDGLLFEQEVLARGDRLRDWFRPQFAVTDETGRRIGNRLTVSDMQAEDLAVE